VKGQAYVVRSEGTAIVNGTPLNAGDGAEITGEDSITFHAGSDAELLVIEV
jgi:redox-sensitive bicupin YhaK (pirin superfamily)